MTKKLIADIENKLFGDNRKRWLSLLNRDGFFNRHDVIMALQYARVEFATGNSLDLRILWETEWKREEEKRCVFLMKESLIFWKIYVARWSISFSNTHHVSLLSLGYH